MDTRELGAFQQEKLPDAVPERSSAPSPFRVDEGYSEDPRNNQNDSDSERDSGHVPVETLDHVSQARQWLLAQPVELRTGISSVVPDLEVLLTSCAAIASELLLSLPNAAVSQLVFEANLRLHFDPVKCLPHEIITQIFHYLHPITLCKAALVSRSWRQRALDPKLWRRLFSLEGWTYSSDNVRAFEQEAKRRLEHADKGKARKNRAHEISPERSSNKKFRGMETLRDNVRHSALGPDADGSMDLPEMWLDLRSNVNAGITPTSHYHEHHSSKCTYYLSQSFGHR